MPAAPNPTPPSVPEPVTIGGAVIAVIVAVLALLVGLGVIDETVSGLLLGVAVPVIGLITYVVRSKVTPV